MDALLSLDARERSLVLPQPNVLGFVDYLREALLTHSEEQIGVRLEGRWREGGKYCGRGDCIWYVKLIKNQIPYKL